MIRSLLAVALLVLSMTAVLAEGEKDKQPPQQEKPPPLDRKACEKALIDLVNKERAKLKLSQASKPNDLLTKAAEEPHRQHGQAGENGPRARWQGGQLSRVEESWLRLPQEVSENLAKLPPAKTPIPPPPPPKKSTRTGWRRKNIGANVSSNRSSWKWAFTWGAARRGRISTPWSLASTRNDNLADFADRDWLYTVSTATVGSFLPNPQRRRMYSPSDASPISTANRRALACGLANSAESIWCGMTPQYRLSRRATTGSSVKARIGAAGSVAAPPPSPRVPLRECGRPPHLQVARQVSERPGHRLPYRPGGRYLFLVFRDRAERAVEPLPAIRN